jgi:hypothetical protein
MSTSKACVVCFRDPIDLDLAFPIPVVRRRGWTLVEHVHDAIRVANFMSTWDEGACIAKGQVFKANHALF